MRKEFYLELWLGSVAIGAMFLVLLSGLFSFAFVGGYILTADEPLFFKIFFGGFDVLLMIPTSFGVWGCFKLLKSRHAYRRDFSPRVSDHFEAATLDANVKFFGRWPQVGAYEECVLTFSSGKAPVTLTPKFISSRAFDAIATSADFTKVKWEGKVFCRDGFPYLFRDDSFRLWFIPSHLDDKPTKVL